MEVAEGYKECVLGTRFLKLNIPAHWEKSILGNYTTEKISYGVVTAKEVDSSEGIPMIRSGGIDTEKGINKNIKFIDKINEANYKKTRLTGGEILIALVGATIGLIGIAPSYSSGYNVSRAVAVVRLIDNCNSNFIMYLLRSSFIQKKINVMTSGSAQPVINLEQLNKLPIILPPLSEQKKIAEILSSLDKQISTTQAIIDKSKELKKGLMQRFFLNKAYMIMSLGETEQTELKPARFNELGKILTGTTPPTAKEEYYNSKDYMFIGPADMGKIRDIKCSNKYISNMGFEVARKLPTNAIMVVCIGATIGKVGLTIEPCATNQQVNTIVPKEEYSARYLYYLISGLKKYLLGFAGDTATPQLNKTDFGKVVTFIHKSKTERDKISEILSEADAKIEKEEQEKAKLEELKKGLMQQLLTGKKRVKV